MSIYVNLIAPKKPQLSQIIKMCSKFSELIKSTKNINSQSVVLSHNHKNTVLNKQRLVASLQEKIPTDPADNDKETFIQVEKRIQISSIINSTIDTVQAEFLANPALKQAIISSNDRTAIFNKVQKNCQLPVSDIDTNASQTFIKILIHKDPKVEEAIQYLKLNNKKQNINKINADSAATTKYVIETLNDTIRKDFFPNVDFDKIQNSAAKETRCVLENKLHDLKYQQVLSHSSLMGKETSV